MRAPAMATSTAPESFTRTTTSIPALFLERVGKTPDREAYRYPVGDEWRALTWKQAGDRVRTIAAGLLALLRCRPAPRPHRRAHRRRSGHRRRHAQPVVDRPRPPPRRRRRRPRLGRPPRPRLR